MKQIDLPSKWEIIPLTQGLAALVDEEDFWKLCQFKWHAARDGNTFYARSKMGGYSPIAMHRFILDLTESFPLVDHKNRNGLDNRKSNLRLVNHSESSRNRAVVENAKGYTIDGVGYRRKIYKVSKNGKYVGRYLTPEEAKQAYNEAD